MHAPEGVDVARVTPWFEEHVPGARGPLAFELVAGGHSNLTFSVTDAGGARYVLRRPPLGHVLPTAHDMAREHRIISALGPTPVPVPEALGLCEDPEVNGQPFYVMRWVDGRVLRRVEDGKDLDPEVRRAAGESLVDVLAAIHAVDPDAVGLGDLGRREGYVARQLKRWYGQYEQSRELVQAPLVDEVHARLSARIPEQGPATVVHGDYRLDNTLVDEKGHVVAVLDWEICTLGDPLADVGLLLVYWNDPDDDFSSLGAPGVTTLDGFPRRAEVLERYAAASGRDLSDVGFYVAFGYWKLACVLAGVYARYAQGAKSAADDTWKTFRDSVGLLAEAARDAARDLG
jgi:aminoglycoside phosphotransferase (APT) family kinase protein